MKIFTILLIAAFIATVQTVKAQTSKTDSMEIVGAAQRDANRFQLRGAELKKFRAEHFAATSDYFRPGRRTTTNTVLLKDSLYVHTFQNIAYNNTVNDRYTHSFKNFLPPPPGEKSWDLSGNATPAEKAARRDGRRFRLPKDVLIKFKTGQIPATSDYFKPTEASASNPTLLTDSSYVKAYRSHAFFMANHQLLHPAGTALLIAGSVVTVVTVTVILVVTALSHSLH